MVARRKSLPVTLETPKPVSASDVVGGYLEIPEAYDSWKKEKKYHIITIVSMSVIAVVAFLSIFLF